MPKPYKVHSTRPLPPDAEIVEQGGKPHVRLKINGRNGSYQITKDGKGYLRPSKCYYFDARDANGTVRRVKGFTDLKATEQLAAEAERKAARVRVGIIDPAEEHARRPLADHLKDYAKHLDAKGNVAEHNTATVAKITAAFTACRFVYPTDLEAPKVEAFLTDLRRPGRTPDLPPGDAFSSSTAATLLNLPADTVRRYVARYRLPTVGTGRRRKLTRGAVEAIAERAAKGAGPRTVNSYAVALKGFGRWLVREKRIGANPFESLPMLRTEVDVRRGRRGLAADELQALLTATRASDRVFRGLTGHDRYTLYLVAAGTGFRANALANLTPADFDMNTDSPTVTLPARFAKNRRTKVQPVRLDVAAELRAYVAGKPPGSPVWAGTWASGCTAAEMLRIDLEAAGIPYAVEGPNGPKYVDFHAFRHTFLTMLGRSGVDLRTAQVLAGHSTPLLTAKYMHVRSDDQHAAVAKLPSFAPPTKPDDHVRLGVVPGVVTGSIPGQLAAPSCISESVSGEWGEPHQPLKMTGAGASQHRPAPICTELPGKDSNLDKENQNLLCYRYTTG